MNMEPMSRAESEFRNIINSVLPFEICEKIVFEIVEDYVDWVELCKEWDLRPAQTRGVTYIECESIIVMIHQPNDMVTGVHEAAHVIQYAATGELSEKKKKLKPFLQLAMLYTENLKWKDCL